MPSNPRFPSLPHAQMIFMTRQSMLTRSQIWMLLLLSMLTLSFDAHPQLAHGQDGNDLQIISAQNVTTPEYVEQQIIDLSDPSYRKRQLARWRLEQSPLESIEAIETCLGEASYNTGAQLVDILSALATHVDVTISIRARQTLQRYANRVSAVGRLADNALHAIADLQEAQALQILSHHGARLGPSNYLQIVLNGKPIQEEEDFALVIDNSFTGDNQVVAWIQFLKSVDTVYFEGPRIGHEHFHAISELPNIKKLKCKHVSISQADLMLLKNFAWLELLELAYTDIDDTYLTLLGEMPVSETLRLFGTQISSSGAQQLAQQLDGIEIYCGKGGHLGIATHPSNTIVTGVGSNTGAERAGIKRDDELTHVDGVEITNMSELRAELAKHAAGDSVIVALTRHPLPGLIEELSLKVTLTEDPN